MYWRLTNIKANPSCMYICIKYLCTIIPLYQRAPIRLRSYILGIYNACRRAYIHNSYAIVDFDCRVGTETEREKQKNCRKISLNDMVADGRFSTVHNTREKNKPRQPGSGEMLASYETALRWLLKAWNKLSTDRQEMRIGWLLFWLHRCTLFWLD